MHILLLGFGLLALIAGLCGALWRLGWTLPHGSSLAAIHGPLMISGVFGTLISLERTMALGRRWAYAPPVLAGIGSLALIVGAPMEFGAVAYVAAAVALAGISLLVTMRQPGLSGGALLLGALAWLVGNILWLAGQGGVDAAGWWLTFLIATIAGERMELGQSMQQEHRGKAPFLFACGLLIVGAHNGLITENGDILYSIGLFVMAAWSLRHDHARRSLRETGQSRFTAIGMLVGYVWLAVAGLVLIASPSDSVFTYDITLHAILVGLVLSTALGHAPMRLSDVAHIKLRYAPILYLPLALLHLSVALRVGSGLAGWDIGGMGSGVITVIALLTFIGSLGIVRWRDEERARRHRDAEAVQVVALTVQEFREEIMDHR